MAPRGRGEEPSAPSEVVREGAVVWSSSRVPSRPGFGPTTTPPGWGRGEGRGRMGPSRRCPDAAEGRASPVAFSSGDVGTRRWTHPVPSIFERSAKDPAGRPAAYGDGGVRCRPGRRHPPHLPRTRGRSPRRERRGPAAIPDRGTRSRRWGGQPGRRVPTRGHPDPARGPGATPGRRSRRSMTGSAALPTPARLQADCVYFAILPRPVKDDRGSSGAMQPAATPGPGEVPSPAPGRCSDQGPAPLMPGGEAPQPSLSRRVR